MNSQQQMKRELTQLLDKAYSHATKSEFEQAQRWGEVLLRKLEMAAVFKAGSVHVDCSQTQWLSRQNT